MSYITTYNEDRYKDIAWITEKLTEIQPGCVLEIEKLGPSLSRTRHLLYEWLHHNSLKSRFRIKVNGPLGRLDIIRLGSSQGATASLRQPTDTDLDPLLEELIMLEPESPEDVVKEWLGNGKLTSLSDASRLLSRYEAVMQ